MNELFAIYDNCDIDFRKKYFQEKDSFLVCKCINEYRNSEKELYLCYLNDGAIFINDPGKNDFIFLEDIEIQYVNSGIKIMYAIFQCQKPICDMLSRGQSLMPLDYVGSEEELDAYKGVLPPLTSKELYYALDFLNDSDVRRVLSFASGSAFQKIYAAYVSKDKHTFVTEVDATTNIRPSLIIYSLLFNSSKMKPYLEKSFIDNKEDFTVMSIFHCISPSLIDCLNLVKLRRKDDIIPEFISFSKKILTEFKTIILAKLSDPLIPTYIRKQADDIWQKRNFIFEGIETTVQNVIDDDSPEGNLLFTFMVERVLEVVHKKMEDAHEDTIEGETSSKNEQAKECGESDDLKIEPLGKSSLIHKECEGFLLKCKKEGKSVLFNDIYRWTLDCLFEFLTGELPHESGIINKQIDCSKEDFVFILGGIMTDEEKLKISEEPTIKWDGSVYDMVAFIYAFCGYLSNKDKHLDPDPCNKSMAFLCMKTKKKYDKLSDQIRENNETHMQRVEHWDGVIRKCCEYVKEDLKNKCIDNSAS